VTSSLFAKGRRSALCLSLAAALGLAATGGSLAQRSGPTIIRDAEIEALLRDYAAPIFAAAGVGSNAAEIVLVQDNDFNAFVASGRRMVINTGTILQAKTPNEVIGVIAHETGHLAGGHLEKLHDEVARARAIGAALGLIGMAGMVGGAVAGSSTGAQMGQATTMLGPTVATRTLLAYRRDQEYAADRAALTYLKATHQSAKGMVVTFERFADQELLAARYADPYAQTHPMPRDRLEALEDSARKSPYWDATDSPALQFRHDLARAKLAGFTLAPASVGKRYPPSDKSLPAQYARAIVTYRSGSPRDAVRAVDALIAQMPDYAYFHELKGQILFEAGDARAAIAPLRKAVSLTKSSGLIRVMLGGAEVSTGDQGLLKQAISDLTVALADEPLSGIGYRYLAMAYQKEGRTADALLATAEGTLISGDVKSARAFAQRAQAGFARGSPGWLKAGDIIGYKDPRDG
jgi:predicted Zn-dependent protease